MEKSDILRTLLRNGYQVDVETLNYFYNDEKAFNKFLEETKKKNIPTTITRGIVDSILKNDLEITEHSVGKQIVTAEDFAKILFERFTIIKKILLSRLDLVNLVSISKIGEKTKRFSLVGIVREKDESTKTISIADDTGEINLRIDATFINEILVNDVLGFVCERNENIHVANVVFPDVPLRRIVKNLDEECSIVFARRLAPKILGWLSEYKNQAYVFVFSGETSEIPNTKTILIGKNPTSVRILNALSVLLFNGSFLAKSMATKNIENFILSQFRKRYFNATVSFDSFLMNNAFILQEIPDMIVIDGMDSAVQTNYKGTTLLTLDENTAWIINLRTREIIKLSET